MKSIFFSILGSLFLNVITIAQAQSELERTYLTNIPFHQEVISGGYYVDPPPNIEGNPYFKSKSFENGTITINGLTYESVPLLYNIQKDQIITFHPVHSQKILLNSEKINAFILFTPEKSVFVQIENNDTYPHHNSGFYELVKDGDAQLLCKHYKTTSAKKEVGKYSGYFTEDSDYLLKKNKQVIVVKKRKQAFEFLGLEKKELLKELKKNGIYFRGNPRAFLGFLTAYHNQQVP
ncbi:hypothetical protein [Aquiflexum lacus]|uniref:hypothetical protein n=1 Tax=Aquiflexum lacus TaxID=2483805 RepID=UPI001892EE39|nr:hypothetical protein [Aquiflexum lacus]